MASGLAMLLGMMEIKTPAVWQQGKAGRVKGGMEPAQAWGTSKEDFSCLGMSETGLGHQPSMQLPYGSVFHGFYIKQ